VPSAKRQVTSARLNPHGPAGSDGRRAFETRSERCCELLDAAFVSSSAWWIVGGWIARRDRGLRKPGAAKPHSLAPARRQNNPAPLSANRFVLTLAFARSTPTIAAAAEGVARRVCRAEFDWAREDVVDGDRMSSRLGVFNSGCSTRGIRLGVFQPTPLEYVLRSPTNTTQHFDEPE
jgi:hypothetical protein